MPNDRLNTVIESRPTCPRVLHAAGGTREGEALGDLRGAARHHDPRARVEDSASPREGVMTRPPPKRRGAPGCPDAPDELSPVATMPSHDSIMVARAGGVWRANSERSVSGRCLACPMTLDNAGAAASHTRASRHTVAVDYRVRFNFVPVELVGGER
jgi:hypothetical protein